jgi:hypothetical protein
MILHKGYLYSFAIIISIAILLFLRYSYLSRNEGFVFKKIDKFLTKLIAKEEDPLLEQKYEALKLSLKNTMTTYCELTKYAQDYMRKLFTQKADPSSIVKDEKPIPDDYGPEERQAALKARASAATKSVAVGPPGETPEQAELHILKVYSDVYACKDDMASSRPLCLKPVSSGSDEFIPCSVYLNLPKWDKEDTVTPSASLTMIPNKLAIHIQKELDWYDGMITKLSKAADLVTNMPSLPAASEGFVGKKCTAADIKAKIELERKRRERKRASGCVIPPLGNEIKRVTKILNSRDLKSVISRCPGILENMKRLKKVMDDAENGFGSSKPTKTYKVYDNSDRSSAFVNSILQNRS